MVVCPGLVCRSSEFAQVELPRGVAAGLPGHPLDQLAKGYREATGNLDDRVEPRMRAPRSSSPISVLCSPARIPSSSWDRPAAPRRRTSSRKSRRPSLEETASPRLLHSGPQLEKGGDDHRVPAGAPVLDPYPFAERPRHEHPPACVKLLQLKPADVTGHFDVVDRIGPEESRGFGMSYGELDFKQGHRIARRPPALPGVLQQLAREDGVVQWRRDYLGEERTTPPPPLSVPGPRIVTSLPSARRRAVCVWPAAPLSPLPA